MKINVTANIRTNTRKFSSVDGLPPDLRAAYEQAMANKAAGKPITAGIGPAISTRLVVNGHEVDPSKEMSEAEQKLYEDICHLLKSSGTAAAADLPPITPASGPLDETGWLTRKQRSLVLAVILLAAVALALSLARSFFLP